MNTPSYDFRSPPNGVHRESNLNNPRLTTILFAIMVKRLGGVATITQADIDAVAFDLLEEEGKPDGSLEFRLLQRKASA